ncbi:MAG: hypothetical protein K9G58_06065 [Bacteroidales bacterium]|nr:hypothetical protein [Bacteroidales bacterium]MCF8397712.1 hypothetical protein [Bacteroidales bacterium]
MSKIFSTLAIILMFFIGITGWMIIHNREYIPENAKIFVLEEYQVWIPNAEWADNIFQELSLTDLNVRRVYKSKVESTYGEVENGKYEGFQLPESWKKEIGADRIIWGRESESLLRSWIFPKKNRWNKDGSWNW